jgi:hypothetical protein
MELDNVDVSEIIFKEQISKREYCVVYLVTIRGRACAMKVVSSGTHLADHRRLLGHIPFADNP